MERVPITLKDLENSKKIGEGEYGTVFYCRNDAVKISPFRLNAYGDPSDKHRSENAECTIQKLLSDVPHVTKYIDSYTVDWTHDPRCKSVQSKVLHTEYHANGNLYSFSTTHNTAKFFKTFVFQVAFALQSIYDRYPDFRHNDLKPSNVLVKKVECKPGYAWKDRKYNVQNVGYSLQISDFDFACIRGVVDNYKVLKYHAQAPTYSIGYRRNHKADLFQFVARFYHMVKPGLNPYLKEQLHRCFKGCLKIARPENLYYAPPRIMNDLPTVAEFLSSDLFLYRETDVICKDFGFSFKGTAFNYNDCVYIKSVTLKSVSTLVSKLLDPSKKFKNEIVRRANAFFEKYRIPQHLVQPILVNVTIDLIKLHVKNYKGESYPTLKNWAKVCDPQIKFDEFMQISLRWSWK